MHLGADDGPRAWSQHVSDTAAQRGAYSTYTVERVVSNKVYTFSGFYSTVLRSIVLYVVQARCVSNWYINVEDMIGTL